MTVTVEFLNLLPEKLPELSRAVAILGKTFNTKVAVSIKPTRYDGHHPDTCWPPPGCIDPDHCPVVYAAMMQSTYDGLNVEEALGTGEEWPP